MTRGWHVDVARGGLPVATRDAVLALLNGATRHDGLRPLSEHATLHLRYGGDREVTHLMVWDAQSLVGYAHLDTTDKVAGPSAELVVEPTRRGQGIGAALTDTALNVTDLRPLRLWAHGDSPDAARLAQARGFRRHRSLLQMRRSLYAPLPRPLLPPGVHVRGFILGQDEPAWLALNSRAFATLPDQGGWTRADLDARLREAWFDPAGLLVAIDDSGAMVGTHWTKVHGAANHHDHVHDPIGEVYVLGVAESARGTGLGRALTILGLEHLRERGLDAVMLYVDDSNDAAKKVYEGLGFTAWDADVLYVHDGQA